jgi:hypothetical protein
MRTSVLVRGMLVGVVGLTASLAVVGCASEDPMATDFESVTDNLTPELQTLTERPVDVDRNMAVSFNHDERMFWSDVGRFFYTDRPSFLSPYYVIPTSGQPR